MWQTLTRAMALRGYTIDAAYAAFQEEWVGSITVGKRADFVVVDRDILEVHSALDIARTRVLATLLDGKCVYCALTFCRDMCTGEAAASAGAAEGRSGHDEL